MLRSKSKTPRRVLALFIGVSAVLIAALGWLTWRLLEQDRALESQRIKDRLERTADLVVASLELGLSEIENDLSALPDPRTDALSVSLGPNGVEARPAGRLLYSPFVPPAPKSPSFAFEAGESLEFRRNDPNGAIAAYRALSGSQDLAIRAGAFVRLARCLRKNGRPGEALQIYEELARLGPIPIDGDPADLLAREARCALLEGAGRSSDLEREARALDTDLFAGRWRLDRVSFLFHSDEVRRWLPASPDISDERRIGLALAAAVESLWEQWLGLGRGEGSARGRRSLWAGDRAILLVWSGSTARLAAVVAGPEFLESRWAKSWRDLGVSVSLQDAEAHDVLQVPPVKTPLQALRPSSDTRLPWTLRVFSADPASDRIEWAGRRRLLLFGSALMFAMVLAAAYLTVRAVSRELAVSRLQSDFVSAVSHEFRTPLTSMLHLTDSLDRGIVSDEDRRRQYYGALSRETTRLHRLVESLLNFGRMESGAFEYRFEPVDLAALAEEVVEEFRKEAAASGHRIDLHIEPGLPPVRADREAVGRALGNLLDNAVKYSPGRPTVWVDLAREEKSLALRVRDQGPGIPIEEQKGIFKKFVRGSAARASRVKGTGIGLAMVRHTARAHGGEVRIESRPGEGSTFTIVLPEKR